MSLTTTILLMQCKIVYLKPRSSYRPAMHSDTLWGALCWAMRMLYGEQRLEDFINSYGSGEQVGAASPIYISSAFPYWQKADGEKVHYFPRPLREAEPEDGDYDTLNEAIDAFRKRKRDKPLPLMPLKDFEDGEWAKGKVVPKQKTSPMAHNTINRLTGSTLTANGQGQLFHTAERHLYLPSGHAKEESTGLYFLADGDTETLQALLRMLEHFGIGGDRSSGKGRFDIEMPAEDFHIEEPATANARMALSLYHPTKIELDQYDASPADSPLQYRTVVRQGWKASRQKKPTLYFSEGSVFPFLPENSGPRLGQNADGGTHEEGHPITQYGFGFMINLNIADHD